MCYLLILLLRTASQSLWLDDITKGAHSLKDFRNIWLNFFSDIFPAELYFFPLFKKTSQQRFFSSVFVLCYYL